MKWEEESFRPLPPKADHKASKGGQTGSVRPPFVKLRESNRRQPDFCKKLK